MVLELSSDHFGMDQSFKNDSEPTMYQCDLTLQSKAKQIQDLNKLKTSSLSVHPSASHFLVHLDKISPGNSDRKQFSIK